MNAQEFVAAWKREKDTLLLGLDGEANIGGVQMEYRIHDDQGHAISSCAEIEAEAWAQFQARP